jgi:putative hemin transport protein
MSPAATLADPLATEANAPPWLRLRHGYAQARREGATRHREIAANLGVSEGELIAAHVQPTPSVPGLQAQRLRGPWPELVNALEMLGPVMALTRNPSCVHEKTGTYREASAQGPAGREMGLVLGPEIDLRIFYSRWAHGFAVHETLQRGDHTQVQRSLQFFDAQGSAVHKVFAQPGTDLPAWEVLVQHYARGEQAPGLAVQPAAAPTPARPDAEIDLGAFHQAWASLRDTHEFFGLLRQHGLQRVQALRLAEARFVQPLEPDCTEALLQAAATSGLPIMVFVGNPGVIQIHTGPVRRVQRMGPWLNVMDPGFNLHLRSDLIASAWVVRKPTTDGLVTSLELFDAEGETIAMFFGERKPGRPELCAWRRLVEGLSGEAHGLGDSPCTC